MYQSVYLFVRSFIHPFIHSFIPSSIPSFIFSCIHSFMHLSVYAHVYIQIYSNPEQDRKIQSYILKWWYQNTFVLLAVTMLHVYMHINKTNVYKNMYIYICIYMCIHIYMYIYIYICVCVCMYIYVCIYICIYICMYVCMYVCVCVIYNHIYACLIGADQCKSPMGSATYTSWNSLWNSQPPSGRRCCQCPCAKSPEIGRHCSCSETGQQKRWTSAQDLKDPSVLVCGTQKKKNNSLPAKGPYHPKIRRWIGVGKCPNFSHHPSIGDRKSPTFILFHTFSSDDFNKTPTLGMFFPIRGIFPTGRRTPWNSSTTPWMISAIWFTKVMMRPCRTCSDGWDPMFLDVSGTWMGGDGRVLIVVVDDDDDGDDGGGGGRRIKRLSWPWFCFFIGHGFAFPSQGKIW